MFTIFFFKQKMTISKFTPTDPVWKCQQQPIKSRKSKSEKLGGTDVTQSTTCYKILEPQQLANSLCIIKKKWRVQLFNEQLQEQVHGYIRKLIQSLT